jgi:hypothetical protein
MRNPITDRFLSGIQRMESCNVPDGRSSESQSGVVMPALVAGIHVLLCCEKDVDGRNKPALGRDPRVRP